MNSESSAVVRHGDGDFNKPIIAVANSFTQFVPGHVHLKDLGQLVIEEINRAGGVGKEFNTIAVDDGIAMGGSTNTVLHLLAAAQEGGIGLIQTGDLIRIDIPHRTVDLHVSDSELEQRRIAQSAKRWVPAQPRPRKVSAALKAYAKLITSADKGAIRIVDL